MDIRKNVSSSHSNTYVIAKGNECLCEDLIPAFDKEIDGKFPNCPFNGFCHGSISGLTCECKLAQNARLERR